MPKTISANEAKNRLGTWLGYVSEQNDEVIVESYGKPRAVIMSISSFEEVQALREQKRRAEAVERLYALREEMSERYKVNEQPDEQGRAEALRQLRALREEVRAQNQDLTQEQADEIANRMSRDMIDHMAATGKLVFERDLN